jgi:hypothetical protein
VNVGSCEGEFVGWGIGFCEGNVVGGDELGDGEGEGVIGPAVVVEVGAGEGGGCTVGDGVGSGVAVGEGARVEVGAGVGERGGVAVGEGREEGVVSGLEDTILSEHT